MDETEWLDCVYPAQMLEFLRGQASDRKSRLFACAVVRGGKRWRTERAVKRAVEVAERYAEGLAGDDELAPLRTLALGVACGRGFTAAERVCPPYPRTPGEEYCAFLRCIFGNPFRPATMSAAWLSPPAIALARQAYEERDFATLPILADALEEAGCTNADMLAHCRKLAEHVCGCWVVDLVLGKE